MTRSSKERCIRSWPSSTRIAKIAARAEAGFGSNAATRGGSEPGTVINIHRGKFGHDVGQGLLDRGLARAAGDRGQREDWLEVESRTASAFMAHLAATLGSLEDVEMDPITDTLASLSPFATESAQALDPLTLVAELRMGVLEAVLPGPAEDIPVADLVAFKERYADPLARFRRHIEAQLLDLALVPDAAAREAKLGFLKAELADELEEIQTRMRSRWPRLVFGTLCNVLGAAIPVGTAMATGALPVAGAALPGLIGAVYSARSEMRGSGETRRHPLAYAALARERLAG